jgi:hypothetical protein
MPRRFVAPTLVSEVEAELRALAHPGVTAKQIRHSPYAATFWQNVESIRKDRDHGSTWEQISRRYFRFPRPTVRTLQRLYRNAEANGFNSGQTGR